MSLPISTTTGGESLKSLTIYNDIKRTRYIKNSNLRKEVGIAQAGRLADKMRLDLEILTVLYRYTIWIFPLFITVQCY